MYNVRNYSVSNYDLYISPYDLLLKELTMNLPCSQMSEA
jgi:hypothetical protein